MKPTMIILVSLFSLFFISSCYHLRPQSVASIAPNPEWHVEERCACEGCGCINDFLVGKEITVRVEANNGNVTSGIFTIAVEFRTSESVAYHYTPSTSFVTLPDGQSMASKDFPCSYTIYSLNTFKSNSYLKEPSVLKGHTRKGERYDCFLLYFDVRPPAVEDNFVLDIKSLERDGKPVIIPQIRFSKGLRK